MPGGTSASCRKASAALPNSPLRPRDVELTVAARTLEESQRLAAERCLERAFVFFGGEAAWRRIEVIRLFPTGLAGLLPLLKGNGRTFEFPEVIEVCPQARLTRFLDYPCAGQAGVYERGDVRIERMADGEVVGSSPNHRATFRGLAKNRRWGPLDALYFFGYALVHYHSLPFSLAAARVVGFREISSHGSRLEALEVEFPSNAPTHCRRETFIFDETGCIVRHDYVADVVGAWARGSHLWQNVTRVNGFPIAMRRHVVPRLGSLTVPLVPVLHASFRHAEVERTQA
jgi:hypothetical protein